MRRFWLLLGAVLLHADVHSVKLEPLQIYHLKAAVAAQVVAADDGLEGKRVQERVVVRLDDRVDRASLAQLEKKKRALERLVALTKSNIVDQAKLVAIKRRDYESIKDLRSKSVFEKNARLAAYLGAKATLAAQKEKLQNLLIQSADIADAIAKLKDRIAKENPPISGYVLRVHVRKGDFVNPGSPLVDFADISKARGVLYLSREEVEKLPHARFFIDGKEVQNPIVKLLRTTDENYISQYRAEIVVDAPKLFGKIIKLEIR